MIKTAYRWDANWKISLLCLLLLPLLLWLGFWQLDRADEKRELQQAYNQQQLKPPLSLRSLLEQRPDELAHRWVRLQGYFDNSAVFLLDNQIRDGKVGYALLQPLVAKSQRSGAEQPQPYRFIVNRGWLAGNLDRSLPELPLLEGEQTVLASVYVATGAPVMLADDYWQDASPRVIQSVDMDKIAALFDGAVFPHVLRLEAGQPAALRADWPVVNTRPEKHTGYAVQWFAMSAALVLCWLYVSVARRPEEN